MIPDGSSQLQKAVIYEVGEQGNRGKSVSCMFNPSEYTISKSNQYSETPNKTENSPHADILKVGARTLKLNLFFDTYDKGSDVNEKTKTLWEFMERRDGSEEPRQVAFEWSVFKFVAYITNLTQQFTLFTHEGMPVRAKVDVSFTEYKKKLPNTNPTSGGGPPERMWRVVAGDRLDLIAFHVYNDATQWRKIAEHNRLINPLILRPGQILQIPKD